ncbi:uncharacterized protein LOC120329641 [Styela clava]
MELGVVDFCKCNINCSQPIPGDLKKVGDEIYEAFTSIGFVYLKNTGISDDEAAKVQKISKDFFDLDDNIKLKYAINENLFGYVAPGVENNDPTKPGEYKESFDVSSQGLVSPNSRWPDGELPGFSVTVKNFTANLRKLAIRIIQALSIGMKVKDATYLQRCHSRLNDTKNITTLRSLYYPKIPHNYVVKEGEMRLGEHTDFGSFTILFQDFIGGLQVRRQDGTFTEARPIPGTALVNIGDCLQFWTRGRLKSTIHRIPMPDIGGSMNQKRSSLVYFVVPDNETDLSEIDCEGIDALPQENTEKPITALEHLRKKYEEVNLPIPN